MKDNRRYFVVTEKAVPDVLLKVVEAKRLLDIQQYDTVQEAVEAVGISRSSFYKYKDDIFPFHASKKGRNITFVIEVEDQPGVMATVLQVFANYKANILTIHQSIPINGIATLTLSIEILSTTGNISEMVDEMEENEGVHYLKIVGRE